MGEHQWFETTTRVGDHPWAGRTPVVGNHHWGRRPPLGWETTSGLKPPLGWETTSRGGPLLGLETTTGVGDCQWWETPLGLETTIGRRQPVVVGDHHWGRRTLLWRLLLMAWCCWSHGPVRGRRIMRSNQNPRYRRVTGDDCAGPATVNSCVIFKNALCAMHSGS